MGDSLFKRSGLQPCTLPLSHNLKRRKGMKFIRFIGIDVSKKTLDASIFVAGEVINRFPHIQVRNDKLGFRDLLRWTKEQGVKPKDALFGLEFTGYYSDALEQFLTRKQISYTMLPTTVVKHYPNLRCISNKKLVSEASQTAAEIIYDRADSEKEFMGLTSFKGADVTLDDVRIAKNYLSEKELKKLNALVSAFFDMAEYQAENHNVMHMSDYVEQLDRTIQSVGEEVLEGAGKISHKKAMEKAEGEYRKYQVKTLSSVEKAYIETLKELKKIEKKSPR